MHCVCTISGVEVAENFEHVLAVKDALALGIAECLQRTAAPVQRPHAYGCARGLVCARRTTAKKTGMPMTYIPIAAIET